MLRRESTLRNIWKAVRQLNPGSAVAEARRPFTLAVVGASEEEVSSVREFLLGLNPTQREHACSMRNVKGYVAPLDKAAATDVLRADLVLATPSALPYPEQVRGGFVTFDPLNPEQVVRNVLDTPQGNDLRLALGACFPAFRLEAVRRIEREIARENVVFVVTTALGGVVPSVFQPILGVAEAASDTVFLTANQVRMLFLIGAVYGEPVGYTAQWREVGSIMGAAFGWRAIARQLVSKIPFGGGLAPKGATAYAGTVAVGEGLIFYYTTGRHMTRLESGEAFRRVYSEASAFVKSFVGKVSGSRSSLSGSGKGNSTSD